MNWHIFSSFMAKGSNIDIKNTEIFNKLSRLEQPTHFNHVCSSLTAITYTGNHMVLFILVTH